MFKKILGFTAVLCLTAFTTGAMAQNDAWTASAQTPQTSGSQQVQFNFTITRWSTQDEIKQLGAILKDKGQDALLAELQKLDAGRINKIGDTGNQIALAEKWQDGGKTVITMIAARRMSLFETNARPVSKKYPLAFLQVTVDSNGEGSGKLVAAATVKYDKKSDSVRLEPYGQGATPVTNVKPLK
jgi:hypothetical protein